MRIFISHATKNREIVLKFADFLESVSSDIEVFCSSEDGSIKVGKNFVTTIFGELNKSDLFVPVISREYYNSRFCMIELGVACSYLYNQSDRNGEDYIFPFALYPVQKGEALSGTPIANIQTGDINDEKDIHSFLEYLSAEKGLAAGAGINRKLHSFMYDLDQIRLKNQNILEMANVNVYFGESGVDFKRREDIVSTSAADDGIVVNFNMNPYEKEEPKRPNFISLVLGYVDTLDIGRHLDFNSEAEFRFEMSNFTNSVKRIFVEFKYEGNSRILAVYDFPVFGSKNVFTVPLGKMKSKALSSISEICFVIHPDDVVEDEGMFKIGGIKIC